MFTACLQPTDHQQPALGSSRGWSQEFSSCHLREILAQSSNHDLSLQLWSLLRKSSHH